MSIDSGETVPGPRLSYQNGQLTWQPRVRVRPSDRGPRWHFLSARPFFSFWRVAGYCHLCLSSTLLRTLNMARRPRRGTQGWGARVPRPLAAVSLSTALGLSFVSLFPPLSPIEDSANTLYCPSDRQTLSHGALFPPNLVHCFLADQVQLTAWLAVTPPGTSNLI